MLSSTQHIRICSGSEMRAIDEMAEKEYLIDANLLMENAGRAAATVLLDTYPHAGHTTEVLVFAGLGNNAGDAFVTARRLLCLDRRVRVFHLENEERYKGPVLHNFRILKKLKAKMTRLETIGHLDDFFRSSPGPYTIIDGIFGTGLKGNLEGIFFDVVEAINRLKCEEVLALDIPSGVSGDTGAIRGTSIQASLTVSFGFPKLGHFLPPGASRRGKLTNIDISLPSRFKKEGDKFLLIRAPLARLLTDRDRYGHKNSFGHTLLIGGAPGRVGAISMAAAACQRMGTGLTTVATWEDSFDLLSHKLSDESMAVRLKLSGAEYEGYKKALPSYSSIVVGPGLGMRPDAKAVLEELFKTYQGALVLDADALNLVADHKLHGLLQARVGETILTPHPGEMARLLGKKKSEIMEDPIGSLKEAVEKTHSTVLLKGAATLMASTNGVLFLNHYPNDGMATAGSGDVLAGIIGGLVGQGIHAFSATQLGVYLHSLAGDFAARELGHRSMTAPDIVSNISKAIKELSHASEKMEPVEFRAQLL